MYQISITPEEIDALKPGTFPGEIVVIDSPGKEYDDAIRYLRRQKVLGFDTETKPVFNAGEKRHGTALIQLSGPKKAYLFRINKMGVPQSLAKILANDKILKIGAACFDDVRGIKKYSGFEPKSFVDLQRIVWEWGIKEKSVKKMSAIILGIHISKKEQCSNWEAEKLTPSQQAYAAMDAWTCREMYLKLLESEKNPLTPEQMAPPPPPAPVQSQNAEQQGAKKKKKRHKKKKSTASAAAPQQAAASPQAGSAGEKSREDLEKERRAKRNRKRRERRKKKKLMSKTQNQNGESNTPQ